MGIRVLGPMVLLLFGLSWTVLQLAGARGELRQQLAETERQHRQAVTLIDRIEQRNTQVLEEIDRAQRDKAELAARSQGLQRELARLQAGSVCVNEPVPAAVTDRLRRRVGAANAAAGGPLAPAEPVPDP